MKIKELQALLKRLEDINPEADVTFWLDRSVELRLQNNSDAWIDLEPHYIGAVQPYQSAPGRFEIPLKLSQEGT